MEEISAKDGENLRTKSGDWCLQRGEDGDVDHVAIVDELREAASEVARDQFLKVGVCPS